MAIGTHQSASEYDSRFKIFHELMSSKVRKILLVSTPYDAWIMEEDCRLSERIIHEYRGLNLSNPPRLTWVSSAEEALTMLGEEKFEMVITMPRLADMDVFDLGRKIKKKHSKLPVILLTHSFLPQLETVPSDIQQSSIDSTFIWAGDTEILVALIKSVEDLLNAEHDTRFAGIRIILLVDDSPIYLSSFLPILYKELVTQTQALVDEGLNEEHRLLTMRARPKILIANSYESALSIYENYKPYILGVISDTRFPKEGKLDDEAGIALLTHIKEERWDIPLLLTSSEPSNAKKALRVPAAFIDKNSPSLRREVGLFFLEQLGFGDFIFRMPDGQKIRRVSSLKTFEKALPEIPDESFFYHWSRNDFSRWLFARTETVLASRIRPATAEDFSYDVARMKNYLFSNIRERRRRRQKGVVVNLDPADFDPDTEFFKIGTGSLGGKARGLAFFSTLLNKNAEIHQRFENTKILVPQTLVITTEGFDAFIEDNGLEFMSKTDADDEHVAKTFLKATVPEWITDHLRAYLAEICYPLAVRSSSLLEDAQFKAYAGLYRTYMLPNDHPDLEQRLEQLLTAVKLVYASTFFNGPKLFSKRVGQRTEEEKMAVIIQKLVGETYGKYFYPAISGVGQSYNYYPFSKMRPEEGIASIALGLGKIVMEGQQTLRFSPRYPQLLPQRASVEDFLKNSQQYFYALKMDSSIRNLGMDEAATLERRDVLDALQEPPAMMLTSSYVAQEHRIRDTIAQPGHRILTFAQVLKYDLFPLAEILIEIMDMGQVGMGCPVEVEFSVNLGRKKEDPPEFAILQVRPMTAAEEQMTVDIRKDEIEKSLCFSSQALGNTDRDDISDILFVKPDAFDPAYTLTIADEIREINAGLLKKGLKYLLIGPGRWGSADRWLGIPVKWPDICAVGVIIEAYCKKINTEPSQGSHFFHNITTLGINYITVNQNKKDHLYWAQLTGMRRVSETTYLVHAKADAPIRIKVDGRNSRSVIYIEN
jgi:CheY-like chemotaxis protein